MRRILISLVAALLLSLAWAQGGRFDTELDVEVQSADGTWTQPTTATFPFGSVGQLVRYTITVTNRHHASVPPGEVVFTGRVYEGTRYVAHDPAGIFGGDAAETLYSRVRYQLASGELLEEAPPAERIAGVQWRLLEALAPGGSVDFRYQVRVVADADAAGRSD